MLEENTRTVLGTVPWARLWTAGSGHSGKSAHAKAMRTARQRPSSRRKPPGAVRPAGSFSSALLCSPSACPQVGFRWGAGGPGPAYPKSDSRLLRAGIQEQQASGSESQERDSPEEVGVEWALGDGVPGRVRKASSASLEKVQARSGDFWLLPLRVVSSRLGTWPSPASCVKGQARGRGGLRGAGCPRP